jgi:hypothetical protein
VSCDVQVIHPDGLAEFFKGCADGAVVLGSFLGGFQAVVIIFAFALNLGRQAVFFNNWLTQYHSGIKFVTPVTE